MVLHEQTDAVPVHTNKLQKLLRVAGWRRSGLEWTAVVRYLATQGAIRTTVSDNNVPFEVFWPDARDEATKSTVDTAAGRKSIVALS